MTDLLALFLVALALFKVVREASRWLGGPGLPKDRGCGGCGPCAGKAEQGCPARE